MNKKPMLILIAGPTCSGKDNIVSGIEKEVGKEKVAHLMDIWFYRDRKAGTANDRAKEKEEILDEHLLLAKAKELLAGNDILAPSRKRELIGHTEKGERIMKFTKVDDQRLVKSAEVIIVSGKKALQIPRLREMADLRVFIDADPDLRLIWKIKRSPYYKNSHGESVKRGRNFGYSVAESFELWEKQIRPHYKDYNKLVRNHADLAFINNSWEELDKNVEKIKSYIDLFNKDPEQFKKQLQLEKQKMQLTIVKERDKISPLWLIPTVLITAGITAMVFWMLRRKRNKRFQVTSS